MDAIHSDERMRIALQARLARRYQLRTRHFAIGPYQFAITGVANPDQVLLEMERGIHESGGDQPCWQPYWAQSWESALAIAHELATRDLTAKNVLDLGCGLGLAGAMAAARGATVDLVDAAHPSLLFARLNCWPWRQRVHARRVNWREDTLAHQFDLILAADIVYDGSDWNYLDAFWKHHLWPCGEVLLAEPSRDQADVLASYLEARAWTTRTWKFELPGCPRPIRMLTLRQENSQPDSAQNCEHAA